MKTKQKSELNEIKEKRKESRKVLFDKIRIIIANALYPDDCNCIVCDREIPKGSKYCLCEECMQTFSFNNGRICVRCGSPMDNEACYCLECQNYPKEFDFSRSSLVYEKDVQRLLLDVKFHNNRWIEKFFAEMLYDTYMENHLDADVIIPVPISKEREKERGYNQSYLLAKPLAQMLNLPLLTDVIIKTKDNKRQSSLTAKERRENVLGVYQLLDSKQVKGKKVLVVDDILTTGSTLSEISHKLKSAGAAAVYGLVVASSRFNIPFSDDDYSEFEVIM